MSKRVKVVYIISYIDKAIGYEWTANLLDKEKIDLSFILLNAKPSYLGKYLKSINVPVYELEYFGKRSFLKTFWKVIKLLKKLKPDAIHTHLVDADLIGLTAGKLLGIKKRIYTRHNSNIHKKYHSGAEKFDKICNACCTHIASISKNISKILIEDEKVTEEKIRLVYHGFDLEKFANVSPKELAPLQKKYNPKNRGPVIGVIARYMHWKGIHYILPAFKKVLETNPTAYLIIANAKGGDHEVAIREMLSELPMDSFCEIEFEHNLFALYHLFDVFVHVPIDEEVEAFGQIYVEALAAGIPSVVTNSGIAREFVEHNKNALIVDFENSDQIYNGILKLLGDANLRDQLAIEGKKSVQTFSLENQIQTLEKLYSE